MNPTHQVYILVGPDQFLVTDAIQTLRRAILTVAADFNRHDFLSGKDQIHAVVETANTLPMMGPKRWVHLDMLENLPVKEHAPLLAYLKSPSVSTVLCLSGSKIDKRTKLGQAVSKQAGFFTLTPPKSGAMVKWLQNRAQQAGHIIERDAAILLNDLVGDDVGKLLSDIDKLAVYAGKNQPITTEIVSELITQTKIESIFRLTDAIGCRDLSAATVLLSNLHNGGESPFMLLGMIARQFRLLLRTKIQLSDGCHERNLPKKLGISPFVATGLAQQSQNYNQADLCRAIEHLTRLDFMLKSSSVHPEVLFQSLLTALLPQTTR